MTQLADAGADVSNDIKGGAALAYKAMGTSNKAHQASPFGTGTAGKGRGKKEAKRDWTFWFIIGIIVLFVVVVACIYFVKKYNATSKTYIKVGEHEITQVEFDYYYSMITNQYLSQDSTSLLFMGIDASQPLDEQTCIYDENLTWKDYFVESTVPMIQQVKALCDDAQAKGFEYDVTSDYDSYISSIASSISSAGVSSSYYYEQYFGEYATESRLEPYVKEYLTSQAYYAQLETDNATTDDEVKEEYETNPQLYDTIDYHLYSIGANAEDDATDEELEAAMDTAEERSYEMLERYENGEDWRELCYEYAIDEAKDNYDPENEGDPTEVTGGTQTTISSNYFDWLADDSRKAGDGMVYRDESNEACFIVIFDAKTPYDLETDPSDIAGTLTTEKVQSYIDDLLVDYEVTDMGKHLKYLYVDETSAADDSSANETGTADDSSANETGTADDSSADTDSSVDETN